MAVYLYISSPIRHPLMKNGPFHSEGKKGPLYINRLKKTTITYAIQLFTDKFGVIPQLSFKAFTQLYCTQQGLEILFLP